MKNTERMYLRGIFNQAYDSELPEPELIVHSAQGAQYTGAAFRSLIKSRNAIAGNSRKGTPYDNASMESFYKTLKRELVEDASFEDPEEAKQEVFSYIETYYNIKRMHLNISILSPVEFERMLTK